mmetsp:Transcript_13966/g.35109  ORF Transcript_13966/g.35109 Transcript_13966/m.35109 type:complete len:283 (+) Transcript_13966:217-1065(+)
MQRHTTLNDRMQNQTSSNEAVEAAFTTFRRQQRRPSNLLQCMDKDGNIDAFRYIEYSRQRRVAFLKRADFICKMKSNLQMQQQQQQQQIHGSASLPGMNGLPVVVSSTPNEVFNTAHVVTPEMMHKSLGRRNSMDTLGNTTGASDSLRFMSRSASMPFVSSFAMNITRRPSLGSANLQQKNASFETPRRSLRKEEFEAAEALLFGMNRESKPKTASEKRPSETSCDEQDKEASKPCSKKQKLSSTEEMGSVLSVVSAEDDAGNNNNNTLDNSAKSNTVQDDD